MKNWHAVLGVANNATEEEITKAYRRLAMQHHPDRGGDEEKFKAVKEAYEQLEQAGFRPYFEPPPNRPRPDAHGSFNPSDLESILEQMRRGRTAGAYGRDFNFAQPDAELVANVSLREAYRGFSVQVQRRKGNGIQHYSVEVPPGTPDGFRGRYKLADGSYQTILTRIESGSFHVRGLIGKDNLFNAGLTIGDVEIQIELDALDLITGCWTDVEDFLGEKLQVRVPAGFSPLQRLKVANKGYLGWIEDYQRATTYRQHMYIKITPVFKKPQDLDRQKVLALYNAVGGWESEGA